MVSTLIRFGHRAPWLAVFAALTLGLMGAPDSVLLEQIEHLRAEITRHDELYFRAAAPEITDYEYDLLKRELRDLEQRAGLASDSLALGSDLSDEGDLIPHLQPMLSLDKAYTDEEVAAFFARVTALSPGEPVRFLLEPKFDGVAINLRMQQGVMVSAATRGNGHAGEDIFYQIQSFQPLHYAEQSDPGTPRIEEIELRGEVYLTNAAFLTLTTRQAAQGLAPFRHPRSVAAGSIKLADGSEVAARGLSLVVHGWGGVRPIEAAPASGEVFHRWLVDHGLPAVAEARWVAPRSAAELINAIDALHRQELAYPSDGIVIKVDDAQLRQQLGVGPTAPRWAMARKYAPPRSETILREIDWQVGRTGVLTPVARFDPVGLDGTQVARASLHHAAEVRRRDLRVGDLVVIEKAGQIIPQIASVNVTVREPGAAPLGLPKVCPGCGSRLWFDATETNLICGQWACPEQAVQRLLHFASRNAANIRGLGPGMARKLVAASLVKNLADLYRLEVGELVALPGIGERTATTLVDRIQASRHVEFERVLLGLGLPGVGKVTALRLAREFGGMESMLDRERLAAALSAIGHRDATATVTSMDRPEVRAEIEALAAIRTDPE